MIATFFTRGWKPVLAWTCVTAIALTYVGWPVIEAVFAVQGVQLTLPKADTMPIMELVIALLGLSGIHSYDKLKGVLRRSETETAED